MALYHSQTQRPMIKKFKTELASLLFQVKTINPFKPNYQLDLSISVLRVVRWYFFIFIQNLIGHSIANSGDPDQTQHFVASDLGLHCLPMSHKKDASLTCIWVKNLLIWK